MKTNRLLSVSSGLALSVAALGIGAGLGPGVSARAQIEILAPYWAYQLEAGTFLAELRTFSGVTYRNVRIQAINVQQMQFSHSRGVNIEMLTNIVDPNQYLQRGMEVPRQGGGNKSGGGYVTVVPVPVPKQREPDATVGLNGPLAQLMAAPQQVSTGVVKLTHREQNALIAWSKSNGSGGTKGLGLEKLTEYEKAMLMEWLSARVTAAQGR